MRPPESTEERDETEGRESVVGERVVRARQMKDMNSALHDLCQPLTTLQCRLEMAGLVGSPEAYREGVEEGLTECRRMMQVVGTMREVVQRGLGAPLSLELEATA